MLPDQAVAVKTGSGGRPWVELEKPKPPRVADHYAYWMQPPPELSERCLYWLRQLERGFYPNRHFLGEGYDTRAQTLGVYMWEYLHLIYPLLGILEDNDPKGRRAMEAVGNLARIIEANRAHAAAVEKALDQEPPDVCPECGEPYDPDRL